jgi:hypothetical protein
MGDTVARESQKMSRIVTSETQVDVEMPTDYLSLLQFSGFYKVDERVIGDIIGVPGLCSTIILR